MFYEVLVSKVFRKTSGLEVLTYTFPESLVPGTIVTVPLGKDNVPAIIYRKVPDPKATYTLKPVTAVLYDTPLPSHLLKALIWLSDYYLTPLPQIVNLVLPKGITKKRRKNLSSASIPSATKPAPIPLNSAQKTALLELAKTSTNTKLLHGVTGSGKTNIYLSLAADTLKSGKSVILLVPEIALTSQLVHVFEQTFSHSVTLIHSKQTEAKRHQTFEEILTSSMPRIIIGPRSALFAPLKNLGLIIIDEAHEPAYFQEQPPKYSAQRLASFIGKTLDIPCLYGTATPLISDYYLATKNHSYVALTQKAKSPAHPLDVEIVDLKDRSSFSKNHYFSNQLISDIAKNLEQHEQTLIFHNRRGSAPLTICNSCGWQALCKNCFLPLTLHADSFQLVCHTCGHTEKVPSSCPDCHHVDIIHKGFGTKLLESELKKLFPEARIARFDADNDKSSSLTELYSSVRSGEIDIILGTQTIARGFDFPALATVGVVQADAGLSLPDYSAEERTFHLLTQVIGRVGRGHLDKSHAIIQTFQPNHPVITTAIANDYAGFSSYLLQKRRQSHLPPFYFIAKLSVVYKTERTCINKIRKIYQELKTLNPKLVISQPTPSFHERTPSGYSWQIIVKSQSRQNLVNVINALSDFNNIHLTLDPPSTL